MSSKTIIITGASRGIGLAIAQFLLRAPESTNVVLLARSKAPLEELRKRHPRHVRVLNGDLADFSMGGKAAELAVREFGQIDGLIVNHGMLPRTANVDDSDPEEWRQCFDVNFFSAVAFVKAALPALRKTKGCILFTSSGVSRSPTGGWGAYGASKAAINHLALTLGVEEAEVTSISVRPGVVDTEMQRDIRDVHVSAMKEQDAAKFLTLHKEGRLLKPEQPGHVMAKLVLQAPRNLSGQFLDWNGKDLAAFQDS
ncbi:MAG: short-chain dehydrogenase [Lasallia pustulata]|uniref:Short-chain dehydrogenase n=1 Tax=Lasallia pustulata TaxID=136370 RepID=A0A5M8PSI7_9LECA|nr:MAG: short-chain dehydrogenase [Lasallia pustulata]